MHSAYGDKCAVHNQSVAQHDWLPYLNFKVQQSKSTQRHAEVKSAQLAPPREKADNMNAQRIRRVRNSAEMGHRFLGFCETFE